MTAREPSSTTAAAVSRSSRPSVESSTPSPSLPTLAAPSRRERRPVVACTAAWREAARGALATFEEREARFGSDVRRAQIWTPEREFRFDGATRRGSGRRERRAAATEADAADAAAGLVAALRDGAGGERVEFGAPVDDRYWCGAVRLACGGGGGGNGVGRATWRRFDSGVLQLKVECGAPMRVGFGVTAHSSFETSVDLSDARDWASALATLGASVDGSAATPPDAEASDFARRRRRWSAIVAGGAARLDVTLRRGDDDGGGDAGSDEGCAVEFELEWSAPTATPRSGGDGAAAAREAVVETLARIAAFAARMGGRPATRVAHTDEEEARARRRVDGHERGPLRVERPRNLKVDDLSVESLTRRDYAVTAKVDGVRVLAVADATGLWTFGADGRGSLLIAAGAPRHADEDDEGDDDARLACLGLVVDGELVAATATLWAFDAWSDPWNRRAASGPDAADRLAWLQDDERGPLATMRRAWSSSVGGVAFRAKPHFRAAPDAWLGAAEAAVAWSRLEDAPPTDGLVWRAMAAPPKNEPLVGADGALSGDRGCDDRSLKWKPASRCTVDLAFGERGEGSLRTHEGAQARDLPCWAALGAEAPDAIATRAWQLEKAAAPGDVWEFAVDLDARPCLAPARRRADRSAPNSARVVEDDAFAVARPLRLDAGAAIADGDLGRARAENGAVDALARCVADASRRPRVSLLVLGGAADDERRAASALWAAGFRATIDDGEEDEDEEEEEKSGGDGRIAAFLVYAPGGVDGKPERATHADLAESLAARLRGRRVGDRPVAFALSEPRDEAPLLRVLAARLPDRAVRERVLARRGASSVLATRVGCFGGGDDDASAARRA